MLDAEALKHFYMKVDFISQRRKVALFLHPTWPAAMQALFLDATKSRQKRPGNNVAGFWTSLKKTWSKFWEQYTRWATNCPTVSCYTDFSLVGKNSHVRLCKMLSKGIFYHRIKKKLSCQKPCALCEWPIISVFNKYNYTTKRTTGLYCLENA